LSYAESSRIVPPSSSGQTLVVEPQTFPQTILIALIPTPPTLLRGPNSITKSLVGSPTPTPTETTCWYVPFVVTHPLNSLSTFPLQARPQTLSRNSMHPPPPLHIPALQYTNNSQPQQQQQSRALYPQQNGSLTYPVTSPTSTSSSPTYSVRHYHSNPPLPANSLTYTCDDLISPIICHRLSLDLRAASNTITLFRPSTTITPKSRSRRTVTWLVPPPPPGSPLVCGVLTCYFSYTAHSDHLTATSVSVHTERAGFGWWQSMACVSIRASRHPAVNPARVPNGRTEPLPLFTSHMIFPIFIKSLFLISSHCSLDFLPSLRCI